MQNGREGNTQLHSYQTTLSTHYIDFFFPNFQKELRTLQPYVQFTVQFTAYTQGSASLITIIFCFCSLHLCLEVISLIPSRTSLGLNSGVVTIMWQQFKHIGLKLEFQPMWFFFQLQVLPASSITVDHLTLSETAINKPS